MAGLVPAIHFAREMRGRGADLIGGAPDAIHLALANG
jgi:hypothetical protein